MSRLSAAERRAVLEQLSSWLRLMLSDEHNDVEFVVERGIERTYADDLETAAVTPNGSSTLIVRINGGARPTTSFDDDPPRSR